MHCHRIIEKLEKFAPCSLACSTDNVGLIVGDKNAGINKILLSLDLTPGVIDEAVSIGADMIITHHPMYLNVNGKVLYDDQMHKKMISLIKNDICFIALHTNLDNAERGVNFALANVLGLENQQIFECDDDPGRTDDKILGRVGTVKPQKFIDFIGDLKNKLNLKALKYVGCDDDIISKVAVISGSGGKFLENIKEYGADVFVTADVKYGTAQYAFEENLKIIDAGHFETEIVGMDELFKYIKEEFENLEIIKSKCNSSSFWNYS